MTRLPISRAQSGQALVLLGFLIPLVLIPIAGYAVEATYASNRAAILEWACTRAAEDAAQSIDAAALRQSSTLQVDPGSALGVAQAQLTALDPAAILDSFSASGSIVDISAHELVVATLAVWTPGGRLRVGATARARLTPGYSSPSSRLAFSTSSFWLASAESSRAASSSRQREGWMNG